MATSVFDDAIDLQIGLIEAGRPDIAMRGRDSAYPYPSLTPTGDQEMRRFRTIVLENPHLRVVVVPALGGRIVSLFDKRTSTEILQRYAAIEPQHGGLRGAYVREGVQLRFGADDRLNSLGNVDTAIEDEAVWVAESAGGTGISFHMRISLPPDAALIEIETRVFNRTLEPVPYDGSLAIHLGEGRIAHSVDGVRFEGARDAGLALLWPDQVFDGVRLDGGTLRVSRWGDPGWLAPRQLDTFRIVLVPFSGLGGCSAASDAGAMLIGESSIRFQSTRESLGYKLLLATQDGQTLEAILDLYPERIVEIPLAGLPARPHALALRSPSQEEVLRWDASPSERDTANQGAPPKTVQTVSRASCMQDLLRATLDPAQRSLAHTLIGYRYLSFGEFVRASASFEQALLFNAEDHLTWWAKAIAERLVDNAEAERPELLNAHFLAPLEPALRAEGFLSQGVVPGKDPSSVVEPLTENPENLIEVAALLIEAGLIAEASRWIDEAIRHKDLPMLHILQAYVLSQGTRMAIDAAEHLRAASDLSQPPLPYRAIEWEVLDSLHRR